MTVEFIEEFGKKYGYEFAHFDRTIYLNRRAKNENLPGDLPTRTIEVFEIRENDEEFFVGRCNYAKGYRLKRY